MSKKCGDDLTYNLNKNEDGKYDLVERIPGAFEKMFSNSSSIYTLNDSSFKDIHTGFCEVVSEVEVDVLEEQKIDNLYSEIKKLGQENIIHLYEYPNRPEYIPNDNSDLIKKYSFYIETLKINLDKEEIDRLICLHPDLLVLANEILLPKINCSEKYEKEDLLKILEEGKMIQEKNPNHEQFIESSCILIDEYYPELKNKTK